MVIPKSFSRDMLTFYTGDAGHADIVYYANEKKSAIAPKITDQGADTVSYQVNAVFAQTLSEVSLSLAESISSFADEDDWDGRIAVVADHVREMADASTTRPGCFRSTARWLAPARISRAIRPTWPPRPPRLWTRRCPPRRGGPTRCRPRWTL